MNQLIFSWSFLSRRRQQARLLLSVPGSVKCSLAKISVECDLLGCRNSPAMENSGKQPLLEMRKKKVYYENFPGCKVDRRNDTNSGVPYKEFCFVWVVVLSTGVKSKLSNADDGRSVRHSLFYETNKV